MEGISKDELIQLQSSIFARDNEDCTHAKLRMIQVLIDQCHELQEPWMTLDEFLESGFEGLCFVSIESYVILSERTNYGFFGTGGIMFDISSITHVMPIHKPEPPR